MRSSPPACAAARLLAQLRRAASRSPARSSSARKRSSAVFDSSRRRNSQSSRSSPGVRMSSALPADRRRAPRTPAAISRISRQRACSRSKRGALGGGQPAEHRDQRHRRRLRPRRRRGACRRRRAPSRRSPRGSAESRSGRRDRSARRRRPAAAADPGNGVSAAAAGAAERRAAGSSGRGRLPAGSPPIPAPVVSVIAGPRGRGRQVSHDVADLEHLLHERRLALHLLRRAVRRRHGHLAHDRARRRREDVDAIAEVDRFFDRVRDEEDRRLRLSATDRRAAPACSAASSDRARRTARPSG